MSEIKIYKTKLTPKRNALVDDLSDYLRSLTPTYANESFQYQKVEVDMTIVINVGQQYASKEAIGNYVDLFQDGKHFYFFIMDASWTARQAVALKLSIDSINTFRNDVTFSNKTQIIRQHGDRFDAGSILPETSGTIDTDFRDVEWYEYELGDWRAEADIEIIGSQFRDDFTYEVSSSDATITTHSFDVNIGRIHIELRASSMQEPQGSFLIEWHLLPTIERKINDSSEGVTPVLYKKSEEEIKGDGQSWYIVYSKSALQGTDATVYITADNQITANVKGLGDIVNIDVDNLNTSDYYYIDFAPADNPNPSTKEQCNDITAYWTEDNTEGGKVTGYRTTNLDFSGPAATASIICFKKNSQGTISIGKCTYIRSSDGSWSYGYNTLTLHSTGATHLFIRATKNFVTYRTQGQFISRKKIRQGTVIPYTITSANYEISDINTVDRTSDDLIKIIKLPYCPLDYTIDENGVYNFTQKVEVVNDSGTNRLYYQGVFESALKTEVRNPLNLRDVLSIDFDGLRNDNNESKLYHSDFYQTKFVYDSFSKIFKLEGLESSDNPLLTVTYNVSSLINSNFMFTFNDYVTNFSTEDYDKILIVNRNNELILLNDDYINYLRNGFNYDVKSKNQQAGFSWLGTGLQIVGSVVSFATSFATHGAGIAAGVSLAVSSTGSIASNINSQITAERSIEEKLQQARNQQISVSGAEDIDLLSIYSNNKAKLVTYAVSERLRQQLADLFYYCGYAVQLQGIPNTTSRYWFNYIQCEPVFEEEDTNPYQDFLEDIKARYAAGVTVYHSHEDSEVQGLFHYDWSQEKENYEVSLLQ